jgi:hypothetical protein
MSSKHQILSENDASALSAGVAIPADFAVVPGSDAR